MMNRVWGAGTYAWAALQAPFTLAKPSQIFARSQGNPLWEKVESIQMPFEGRWKADKSENLDDWMVAVGVNIINRNLGRHLQVWEEWFKEDEETYGFRVITRMRTLEVKFKLKEQFTEPTLDGRKCKSIFHIDGNKLVLNQQSKCHSKITREVVDDDLICTFEVDGKVISRSYFKREEKKQ